MEKLYQILEWVIVGGVIGFFIFLGLTRSDEPKRLAAKWLYSFVVVFITYEFLTRVMGFGARGSMLGSYGAAMILAGSGAVCGLLLAIIWGSSIGELVSRPLTNMFDDGSREIEPAPLYAIALARRKRGQYLEAIEAIRRELERFPRDLQGVLMWAEIEAKDLKDFDAAECTLDQIISDPKSDPGDVVITLNQLADWRLKYRSDAAGALEALESIQERFPNTEPSFQAAQRIAHLASAEYLAERKSPHRVRVVQAASPVGEPRREAASPSPVEDIGELVRHLDRYPQDVDARERLARAYANDLGRPELARMQWEELIAIRHASPKQIVTWLNALADLESRHVGDAEAARVALERIIERYPKSAGAEAARTRIPLLQLELKGKKQSRTIASGSG